MDKQIINYSQCWEDTEILIKALNIQKQDNILSITSGGDNTLAILLHNPKQLTTIDLNPLQNYLLELKLAAAKALEYDDYLSFLGVKNSNDRLHLFQQLKAISNPAKFWWLKNQTLIKNGIIHSGRFEKYLNKFKKYILPLAHSQKNVIQFTQSSSLKQQQEFYKNHWNTKRWRFYFRLATSRSTLKNFARQKGMFKYVKVKKVSDKYLERLEQNLTSIPILNNFYMQYCLTGNFNNSLPSYLQEKNFKKLKHNHPNLTIKTSDIFSHLNKTPDNFYSKYNLSDIFEALSDQQINQLWKEIIRTSKNNSIVIYWDNLLQNPVPSEFSDIVKPQQKLQEKLSRMDRVFFYGSFYVYKIQK